MAVSKRLRYEIFRRDGFRCRYCGATPDQAELRPDHVIPEALGGKTEPSNLATACNDCNAGKSSVPPEAATVADVDQRAERWARALADAARQLERDHASAERRHDWFVQAWNAWVDPNNFDSRYPLLPDWPATIDAFFKAGLTRELIIDAIHTVMRKTAIHDRFRYFCGVCWRMADQLSERAEAAMADSAPDLEPVEVFYTVPEFARDLLEVISAHLGDEVVNLHLVDIQSEGTPRLQQLDALVSRLVEHMAEIVAGRIKASAEAAPGQ